MGITIGKKISIKTVGALIGAFFLGVVITMFFQQLVHEKRPVQDTVLDLVPLEFKNINEQAWLQNYDAFLASIESVRSEGNYALLLIVPKDKNAKWPPSVKRMDFSMRGFTRGGEKPVKLYAGDFSNNPDKPVVKVLDFNTFNYGYLHGEKLFLQLN
ncbi:MAG: hypothetical protein WCH99_16275 [Verrucomicrobiota bacterium]